MKLRGVTLVYGPPGAGKTAFTAWYTYNNYGKVFWVSMFEDEESFRRKASFGYRFGERLIFWKAPLAGVEPFLILFLRLWRGRGRRRWL